MRTTIVTAIAVATLALAGCDRGEKLPSDKDASAPTVEVQDGFLAQPKGFRT